MTRLDDFPDLVVIVGGAVIHLDLKKEPFVSFTEGIISRRKDGWTYRSASGSVPIGKVEAFMLVGPGDAFIGGDGEDLVGVAGEAGVDLHLDAIGGAAASNI